METPAMEIYKRPRRLLHLVCTLVAACLFAGGMSSAMAVQDEEERLLKLEIELVQLHQRLEEIQQAALANNPALEEQARELGAMMVTAMEDEGFDPEKSIARIQEIQDALQQENLATDQRLDLMEQAQAEYLMLEQAQAAAMEREEVQTAHTRFQEQVMDAMQDEDPATEEIIAEFTRKHQEYEQIQTAGGFTGASLR
jgi:hypothetical protein